MDGQGFEKMLRDVLQCDFSAGTEAFRDALLARCLAELHAGSRIIELGDCELELLAAAGDAGQTAPPPTTVEHRWRTGDDAPFGMG